MKRCFFNYVKFAAVAGRLLRLEDEALRSKVPLAALPRLALSLARATYLVHLFAQGDFSLSLRRDRCDFASSQRDERRHADCGSILLPGEPAGRKASGRLSDSHLLRDGLLIKFRLWHQADKLASANHVGY